MAAAPPEVCVGKKGELELLLAPPSVAETVPDGDKEADTDEDPVEEVALVVEEGGGRGAGGRDDTRIRGTRSCSAPASQVAGSARPPRGNRAKNQAHARLLPCSCHRRLPMSTSRANFPTGSAATSTEAATPSSVRQFVSHRRVHREFERTTASGQFRLLVGRTRAAIYAPAHPPEASSR